MCNCFYIPWKFYLKVNYPFALIVTINVTLFIVHILDSFFHKFFNGMYEMNFVPTDNVLSTSLCQ